MDNRRKEDLDIFHRDEEYLTPDFRYEYYQNFLREGIITLDESKDSYYKDITEENLVECFNNIEEKLFPESKFVF